MYGLPFIHITIGKCPETGRRIVARGFIAVGRLSIGAIALGHASAGVIALGQLAFGFLFFAQLGFGLAGIGQIGWRTHVWSAKVRDAAAVQFFKKFISILK